MTWDVPLQMRLDFGEDDTLVEVFLGLSGWTVSSDVVHGSPAHWWKALTQAGIQAREDDIRGVTFSLNQISLLAGMPREVLVRGDDDLQPLLQLLADPPPATAPATLDVTGKFFELRWQSATGRLHDHEVTLTIATRLPVLGLPFLASASAWALLAEQGVHTGVIATARDTHEGYVELSTAVPQLVESAPLRGLFRIDATHFGVAACYAPDLDAVPGFAWRGPRPRPQDEAPVVPLPFDIAEHTDADLGELTARLRASESILLAWESGLGRRIAALALTHAVDGFPALVVCPDHAVWLWQRHADLVGLSSSLTHDDADLRIITFDDIIGGIALPSAATIIFDGVDRIHRSHVALTTALHHLDGLSGVYRIGLASSWPPDPVQQVSMLEVVRPGEFTRHIPLEERYPVDATRRLREHAEAYVLTRTRKDTELTRQFARSRVVSLDAPEELLRHESDIAQRRTGDLRGLLEDLVEAASAGPANMLSPKVAACVGLVREAREAGRRIAVITRCPRVAVLVATLSHPHTLAVVDDSSALPDADAVICVASDSWRDVRDFDDVVIMDYPPSTHLIDEAVGCAPEQGPQTVTVLHLSGSIDDRLAIATARRRETGQPSGTSPIWTDSELATLLAPWLSRVRAVTSADVACVVCGENMVRGAHGWHCYECGSAPAPLLRMPR